jgi:hypothetical protein
MHFRPRLTAQVLLAPVLIAGILFALPNAREALLRWAGSALVANDSLQSADIIVISADADGAGVLEAADLVHLGYSARVAVFADPPSSTDREFIRRGVIWHDAAAFEEQQLRALGITRVDRIARTVAGTEDEGRVLPKWCNDNRFGTIIFVGNADHSHRTRRVLRRAVAGQKTAIIIVASPYSEFDPNNWWVSRDSVRTEIVEMEKLLLDIVRHPLS